MFFRLVNKLLMVGLLYSFGDAMADDLKPFQPFEISMDKSLRTNTSNFNDRNFFFQNALDGVNSEFDFLSPQPNGYHMAANKEGVFGDEIMVGMKFADWLSLRLNVIDENESLNLFSSPNTYSQSDSDFLGYQIGVSSVLSISQNWRFGIDLGKGRVNGDLLGLYQDQFETTRLGFGIRNQKFGATFQSDFMNGSSNNDMEQSTMDLQVDWHFTKDGTISFGARRNVRENDARATSLDQLTGTVPYIKFKHNL